MVDETQAIEIVKRAIVAHGGRADCATYHARREGDRWFVFVELIHGHAADGTPLHIPGGHRLYEIDKEGSVVRYIPGR